MQPTPRDEQESGQTNNQSAEAPGPHRAGTFLLALNSTFLLALVLLLFGVGCFGR